MSPEAEGPRPLFPWGRRGRFGLFFLAFSLFLLSGSREPPWADATPMWQLAESIVSRGALDIHTPWPPSLPPGRGGKTYAIAPLIQGLVQVPAVLLRNFIGAQWPQARELVRPLLSHLAPSALGALTVLLFFGIVRRLGLSRAACVVTTAMLALGTTVWVYARYPYSEILQAACFTGFLGQLLETRRQGEQPSRGAGLLLGAWAGLLINAKIVYVLSLPGAALFLAWPLRRRARVLGTLFGWVALAMAPFVLAILAYNYARWENFLNFGYDTRGAPARGQVLWGLWGLLLSPGKSVLLYSPPLVLGLAGLAVLRGSARRLWVLLPLTLGPVIALNASLQYWSGDYAWGPRYLVFAVPALLLPAAFLVEQILAGRHWRRLAGVAVIVGTLGAGLFVQAMGNAFFWDHYIRIQREARNRWLGIPNTAGTPFPDFGGVCGACFEDMHGLIWLPPFQPIEGHAWLLGHVLRGHDWVRAERDGPWHRYTDLALDISKTYPAARIDWWYLDYRRHAPLPGLALLALMALTLLGSSAALARDLAGPVSPASKA